MSSVSHAPSVRTCPFCAEDIRVAAIVCKHCGRNVPGLQVAPVATLPPAVVQPGSPPARGSVAGRIVAIGLVAAVAAVAASESGLLGTTKVGARGTEMLAPAPTVIEVASLETLDVPAGASRSWAFTVQDRRTCRLTGHLTGLAGGRKDVKVFLLTADEYTNWSQGLTVTRVWDGGQAAARTFDATLPGPGAYRLVVDNTFSMFTSKVVQIDGARVTCA